MTPQELKSSILQLAVQGKLVEQRPEEGTAEELYQQIQEEKQRLIKEGKLKKEKPYSTNKQYEEYPFDIPSSWCFVRFGELMITRDSERIPVSVSERKTKKKIYDYYGASGVIDKIDDYLFDKELLLVGEDGANLLARSTPIAFIAKGKYWVNNHAHVLDVCGGLNLEYICYFMNAISLRPYVTGTAQPKMNQEKMNAIWVPLPPLAEQKRIVAKIEELLPYIDRYEKAWSRLEELNKRFPEDMQKSVLQMAIQGKLVEQRSEEGTAEELYTQIQAEKQRLIKEGKIKKEKPLPEITEDEIPFDIPESWKWVHIGDLFQHNTGKALNSSDKSGSPYTYITTSNVYWDRFELEKLKTMLFTDEEIEKCSIKKGDLLVLEGGDVGRAAIWQYDYSMRIQNHIHRLRPFRELCVRYIYYMFMFYKFSGQINGKGIGIKGLSAKVLHELFIPLPPLAEQKRIVEKLEEILPLCENLK